ncbi:BRO1-like domain-containing protein [Kalaharituber pfeilii]|nr:BRO1-like domain-containing protein [Kalaharituber pfeilii]
MRGAGKDSASGRDLLFRYYGQLELLDLRFPIDENHIKISFKWYDAFTHKPTSQHSLAFEKASVIFNISAALSCHAANQNRTEDYGLKFAYHSFQASAGMFTYINENFLHAPSTDLSRDTIKTLINIMLAQAQEVFVERQMADPGKKASMLAKLAAQAALLYTQSVEGVQDNANKGVFEKAWLLLCQVKQCYMNSLSQYFQGQADKNSSAHGSAIARLAIAEREAKEALRAANAFPHNPPSQSNLSSETGPSLQEIVRRHLAVVQEKLNEYIRDNDFIYHNPVPNEAALPAIPKMAAAKAIPVQELYAGRDMQRIIGPDIFSKIVPMSVTESASLYDEEKAKLVRAETEKADLANAEMVAALDFLKLPGALKLMKHSLENKELELDDEFRGWCEEMATECPEGLDTVFEGLKQQKKRIVETLDNSSRSLDTEESVCEKMRSKYQDSWSQQPSARLTITLRDDIRNYREAIDAAVHSDNQLFSQYRGVKEDIEAMRLAGLNGPDDEEDLFRSAIERVRASSGPTNSVQDPSRYETLLDVDDGESGHSVMDQIHVVEDLLKKLGMIKRERTTLLKDLKEKVMADDISNVLILNKKSSQSQESQIFQAELEKFRPHQNRLLQMALKQSALMKELTSAYGDLLQDKRIRAEQNKYEALSRQRNGVSTRFRKTHQAFLDITLGLGKATEFYREMKDTVDSLEKNVETFVANRRTEGASLLAQIESEKSMEADREQRRLQELMERVTVNQSNASKQSIKSRTSSRPPPLQTIPPGKVGTPQPTPAQIPPHQQAASPPPTPRYNAQSSGVYYASPTPPPPLPPPPPPSGSSPFQNYPFSQPPTANGQYGSPPPPPHPGAPRRDSYSYQSMQTSMQRPYQLPGAIPRRESHSHITVPSSPPPQTTHMQYQPSHYNTGQYQQGYPPQPHQPYNPSAFSIPPPPPGPPPPGQVNGRQNYSPPGYAPPQQQSQYYPQPPQQSQQGDPWQGLSNWK